LEKDHPHRHHHPHCLLLDFHYCLAEVSVLKIEAKKSRINTLRISNLSYHISLWRITSYNKAAVLSDPDFRCAIPDTLFLSSESAVSTIGVGTIGERKSILEYSGQ
jgi:hypothetical protein